MKIIYKVTCGVLSIILSNAIVIFYYTDIFMGIADEPPRPWITRFYIDFTNAIFIFLGGDVTNPEKTWHDLTISAIAFYLPAAILTIVLYEILLHIRQLIYTFRKRD
jgi:hypothetical protein